jgi:phage terminase large subunit-like protein
MQIPELETADLSLWKRLALMPAETRERLVAKWARDAGLSVELFLATASRDWRWVGRPKQQPPPMPWTYWFIRAGRGYGKTLSAAEWVKERAHAYDGPVDEEGIGCRIALAAPTLQDVRHTMVEGETGLLSILPSHLLRGQSRSRAWNRGTCELYLENGTYLQGFSSEAPNRLRGPQHHYAWGEEVSSWMDAKDGNVVDSTFSNLTLGLRLGEYPQAVLTSTPKANKLTKDILDIPAPDLALVIGTSFENRDNLPDAWWNAVVAPIIGTRTGRQEILAELLEDVEGALWTMGLLDALRVKDAPPLYRVVVGVDPNASSTEASNSAGIVVAGHDGRQGLDRHGYVLADRTVVRATPRQWGTEVVDAYHEFKADRVVAEKNNGGEMVEHVIRTIDPSVPVKLVSATRGKRTRAEPVAALYEGSEVVPGRVHHAGSFPELEEEMTTWTPEADSPDRMDAAVWALTELMLGTTGTMKSTVPKGRIPTPVR